MHKDDLAALAHSHGFPRVSIYIPTHKAYLATEQDPIRLSNALKEAEAQLLEAGVREAEALLDPARRRLAEPVFWRYQDHGLAVFLEPGEARWLKLPTEVPEAAIVAERYHVLPLIGIFADRGRFHLLAATRDAVRLFEGAERELRQTSLEGLPSGLEEVKERTDFENNVGYHARGRGGQIGGAAMPKYHALGDSPEDYEETELTHFARAVARAVDGHLAETVAPLVLAARPRLLGRLRQELGYRHVADAAIQRDPAAMTEAELHAEAWAIAGPLLRRDRDALRARLAARLDGADVPGSEDLEELMRVAEEGRLATLLVARGAHVWGTYDATRRKAHISDRPGPDNEDLLNLLAVKALEQGAEVIALPEPLAARTGPVAGLYRY